MKKANVYIWCVGTLLCTTTFCSCTVEDNIDAVDRENPVIAKVDPLKNSTASFSKEIQECKSFTSNFLSEEELLSSCELTDFGKVLAGYFDRLLRDPYFDFDLVNYYTELNRKYVTFYFGENYYGANAEYDRIAKKRIKELTGFWKLNRDIYLNAQHTASLDDLETLTAMIESFDRTVRNRDEAYEKAAQLIELNSGTPNIPENPYFALEAFTKSNGLLVIGDGLVQSLVDVGIDGEIAFTAILAHEWWHQAQFEHAGDWNYLEQLSTQAERSRFTELEADYAAAYFLSHKRGATYNWKRLQDFFSVSFNVGDCLTDSDLHHGTPAQRLRAARLGNELAESAHKKGFILPPDEVHQAFLGSYNSEILLNDE